MLEPQSLRCWQSSTNNNRGELAGTLTTETGGAIPIEMDLIKEGDHWKIVFMDVGSAGVEGAVSTATATPSAQLTGLPKVW